MDSTILHDKKGTYRKGFKSRKPDLAQEIESLVDCDLCTVSDIEAFEIVTTLQRWAESVKCSVGKLKEKFILELNDISDEKTYRQTIESIKEKQAEESTLFNISKENTISGFKIRWIQEEFLKRELTSLNKDTK